MAKKLLSFLLVLYIIAMFSARAFQEKIIFQAKPLPHNHQYVFQQPFTELFFDKEGVKINALHFPATSQIKKGMIFYLHGNAGNIQKYGLRAIHFTSKGYDVFMMDYRTFGKSTGELSEAAIHNDVQWIFEEVQTKYGQPASEWIVYGRSLGTGIATHLASNNEVKQLILETPYFNLIDVAKGYFPLLPYNKLLKYTFQTDQWIQEVKAPIAIFHGTKDWIVPYKSGIKLQRLLKVSDQFYTIPNGGHNNLFTFPRYHEWMREVLDKND